jgi:hypothetical protein
MKSDTEITVGPQPGNVYREFTFKERLTPCQPGAEFNKDGTAKFIAEIDIGDLQNATRAETCIEYWGGHIGTSQQEFRINGKDWIPLPQPSTTPGDPSCFYRMLFGNPPVPISLQHLQNGANAFEFRAGPQAKYSFNFGLYWIYSITVRVYFAPAVLQHPAGKIITPESNTTFDDNPLFVYEGTTDSSPIERVDFIGEYEDFDFEGDGRFRKWHYQVNGGELQHHIGSALVQPYSVTWNTAWVPDQPQPLRVMAIVKDETNTFFASQPVEGLQFRRAHRAIRMYKSVGVPERCGAHFWYTDAICKIEVQEIPVNAVKAKLVVSTWSGAHAQKVSFNGTKLDVSIGKDHAYHLDMIDIPIDLIKAGVNDFMLYNEKQNHAAEINWPGPALLIESMK